MAGLIGETRLATDMAGSVNLRKQAITRFDRWSMSAIGIYRQLHLALFKMPLDRCSPRDLHPK
jgi:hypothetical protein